MASSTITGNNSDVLIGTGDRVVKLGFIEIKVYELSLYVENIGCRSSLETFIGQDLNGLLRDSSFYSSFVSGKFRKVFRLKFCRSLGKEKLVGGFDEPLKARCDEAHQSDAELLLGNLVPPEGVKEGDTLSLVCHGDGETLTGLYLPANGGEEQKLIEITSGGTGGAWLALQNIYFDDNTQLPTIRHTAIADLPNVLIVEQSSKQPSQQDIETAIEEELVHPGKKTWSDFAGRTAGPSGYVFGDLTLGVVTALGIRKPKITATSRSVPLMSDETSRVEIQQLQKQVEQLESQNQELQQTLDETEQKLDEMDNELPFKIAAALALTEATYILLDSVADFYVPSLRKFQIYLAVAIGLAGYYKYVVEKEKVKKE